jgi:hypothetical protein
MYTQKRNPGKYEGNKSQLLAQVLDNVIGNGFADEEIGECDSMGHFALVQGKRYSYIVETDNYGFVSYVYGTKKEMVERFEGIVKDYEELEEGEEN